LIAALQGNEDFQYLITMPNADTMGNVIRKHFNHFIENSPRAIGVESLGTIGYLSCMKHCSLMLGNTSSGFIEASFFPKYVINLGQRQSGRIVTPNIRNVPIEKEEIIRAIGAYNPNEKLTPVTIYGEGDTSKRIIDILKSNF
jgi:GDP/UDP-N,N'-diacetylbacillosamine 2-epimerase (hydrolysing)